MSGVMIATASPRGDLPEDEYRAYIESLVGDPPLGCAFLGLWAMFFLFVVALGTLYESSAHLEQARAFEAIAAECGYEYVPSPGQYVRTQPECEP